MIPSQERINEVCKAKNISISQIEKDCGFSNGYIMGERKREFPTDRLTQIAEYLNVSLDYLMYGEDNHRQKQNRAFLASQLELLDAELGIKKSVTNDSDGMDTSISKKDQRLLMWFRSLPPEKQKAILVAQDAPEDLL